MKIFVSWSGQPERAVAEALRESLDVLCSGQAEVFVSSKDIDKGTHGRNAIDESLKESDFGIVVLSRENQVEPWVNYEGGALAKSLKIPVATVLLDLVPTDVTGPLADFQHTRFEEADMLTLFEQVAHAANPLINARAIENQFAAEWPKVRDAWKPESGSKAAEPQRTVPDMFREVITRLRSIEAREEDRDRFVVDYELNESPKRTIREWMRVANIRERASAKVLTATADRVSIAHWENPNANLVVCELRAREPRAGDFEAAERAVRRFLPADVEFLAIRSVDDQPDDETN